MSSIFFLFFLMVYGGCVCVCDKMNVVFRCVFFYRGNNDKYGYYG